MIVPDVNILITDAHLAALVIEYQAELASTDTDFARFPALRWFNPIAARKNQPEKRPSEN